MASVLSALYILSFVAFGAWFSRRADPLGPMPYAWGTWVACSCSFMVLAYVAAAAASLILGDTNISAALKALWAVLSGIAAIQLFRRRKSGVVFFCAFQLSSLVDYVAGPSWKVGVVFGNVIYTAATMIYFKKRWRLLGKPIPSAVASANSTSV